MSNPLLKMRDIKKIFPGVIALDGVELTLEHGEVHALMGENGAGKSTLIKILTGAYQKDGGTIHFDQREVNFRTPMEAQLGGISTIYQEVSLIPYLSVTENIFMGREPKNNWGIVDWKTAHREAEAILEDMGIHIDVRRPVHDLSAAVQQMVSIARAVSMKAKLVVMDEPTSSLDDQEVNVLFGVINKLKSEGVSIIYVSHRLDEIYAVCDKITVLRDGKYVGTWPIEELPQIKLIAHMIGKSESEVEKLSKGKEAASKIHEKVVIQLEGIKKGKKVQNISFEIHRGEVLGLAGLLGSGRTETAKLIFGADQPEQGSLQIAGQNRKFKNPRDAIASGIGFVSENRKTEGIIPNMSVRENITIASLSKISKFGFISRKKQSEIVSRFIDRLNIKTPNADQKIKNLSGGNQQKVLLARWLALEPKLLILDEPTRGIDVGAKAEIHALIDELAQQGLSILMISSEFDELIQNTDRIVILRDGKKIGEVDGSERTEDRIMHIIAENNSVEHTG
ncbi:sugar ABC transporter ATP-binding protein [Ferviditalea candida]|uniref:Sugar ABC transporter ATP-binding protein n=1 Tax=Ferviditalea candida TaxID=3108399 RepID=A0ABU5ZIW5_9BACL|nr:sugar ABC transporter ATP-binding protein [Paenibacillaceae bacterium T2]